MSTRASALRVVRLGLGQGALARPRQAAASAIVLLLVKAVIWYLVRLGTQAADRPPPTAQISGQEITNLLSRSGYGPGGSDVRVLWATSEYFRYTAQQATAAQYDPEHNLVFFVWENIHDGDLAESFRPVLRVDGNATYEPSRVIVPADAVHHRFSVFVYPPIISGQTRSLELILPPATADGARSILSWALPVEYPPGLRVPATHLTWASLLALLGGLLASMWPCLFQLTAYFIPSLAGISMDQARRPDQAAAARAHVMKAAMFFVLGFVIVYTAAGAAAGFAAQSLSGTSLFWNLRRPLSIAAGLAILFMALRVAMNARAPLVCKMPGAVKLGRWGSGYFGTMLLGLAFATGCTTCFGAAVVLGIVAYAGITGTPLAGALIMFLFALGMAIPLLAGAAAMARVLTLLGRLERIAPWMALASSAVMAGFAVLLLSGRFMTLSNWFLSRTTGL